MNRAYLDAGQAAGRGPAAAAPPGSTPAPIDSLHDAGELRPHHRAPAGPEDRRARGGRLAAGVPRRRRAARARREARQVRATASTCSHSWKGASTHGQLLVTGGAGFIGSNFVHHVLGTTDHSVIVLDSAHLRRQPRLAGGPPGGPASSWSSATSPTPPLVDRLFGATPTRSCTTPRSRTTTTRCTTRGPFLDTNIIGTYTLLEAARRHGTPLPPHLHRRGLRRPRARRPAAVHRATAVQPVLARTPRRRRAATCSCAPGCARSGCRRRSRTARTTTARTSTSRSSSPARSPTCSTACGPKLYGAGQNVRDWIHADDHSSAVLTDPRAGAGSARPT